jgi:competence protein ComEC
MNPLNLFGLALLISQLINPAAVYSLAFQLSFLSVAGMLFFGRALYRLLQRHVPAVIRLPLVCSIGAQLATAPVQIASYGIYYPVSIIVTVLLLPLVSAFIWCGLAVFILISIGVFWFDGVWRAGMHVLYMGILAILRLFAGTPGLTREFLPYYWYVLSLGIVPMTIRGIASRRKVFETDNEEGCCGEL